MTTTSGRPLLDNAVDAELFVGRQDELAALTRATQNGFNTLVTGNAGVGRTSLLRHWIWAQRQLHETRSGPSGRDSSPDTVFARVEGAHDVGSIIAAVLHALDPGQQPMLREGANVLMRLADTLGARTSDLEPSRHATTIVLDDVSGRAGHKLFGQLRDQLWELPAHWLVGVRTPEAPSLMLPPADAFFDARIDVEDFGVVEVDEVVARRVGESGRGWARHVFEMVGGNPRAVLSLARGALSDDGELDAVPVDLLHALSVRQQAISALGQPAVMLTTELTRLGAASASDEVLLASLGWTRARAAQVLKRLEAEHLVIADEVRLDRGRPRKAYRLTPAELYRERTVQARCAAP